MIRVKWLVIVSLTSLVLASCSIFKGPVKESFTCALPLVNNQSDTLNIEIKVDGSSSMLGYVSDRSSRYVQTLKYLDRTLSIGGLRSNTSEPKYYRSSKSITRSDFKKAQQPSFYDGSNSKFPNISVPIQEFITPPGETDTLLAIVTDLDQAEGDVTILLKKIKETYLNKDQQGYAVGIWAIKSEFRGTVYVQKQSGRIQRFYFPNQQSTDRNRPFYVIFIGLYQDINRFFENLSNNNQNLLNESELAIFSPNNVVKEISYLDKDIESGPQKKQARSKEWSLKYKNLVKVQAQDEKSQLWEIYSRQTETFDIQNRVNLALFNYTLPIETSSITLKPNIRVFNKYSKKFQESDDSSLKSAIKIGQWNIDNTEQTNGQGKLGFTSTIQPDKLPEPGIYLFTFDIVAKKLQEPEWWNEWSWTANRDSNLDGSKTHNLSEFLRGLKTITTNLMEKNPPIIGRFCYAIQKN
ncbi:MAG: hypothetical protein QNJ54_22395 [Prochloraceae cyanobacterium]|nr:hypothetical protein [Prochloraceae cyanobacterium]